MKKIIISITLTVLLLYGLFAIVNGLNSMAWSDGTKDAFLSVTVLCILFVGMGVAANKSSPK